MLVQLDHRTLEGCVSGHADIRAGSYSCRLMRAGHADGADQALEVLSCKARDLIDDRHTLAAESRRDMA